MNIRVGLDGRPLQGSKTGIGRYVFELCRALDAQMPEATFFVYSQTPVELPGSSSRWIPRVDPWGSRSTALAWLKMNASLLCRRDQLDVFWATMTLMPVLPNTVRRVSSVYDLNHKVVPKTMLWRSLLNHRMFFGRDVKRADCVLALSHGSAARLLHYYSRCADAVVTGSVDAIFMPASCDSIAKCLTAYGIQQPYLLAVATHEPRKNLGLLIKVFSEMKCEGLLPEHRLILVGKPGWKSERLEASIKAGARHGISCLGFVPDQDLAILYSAASVFVFPSLYEGLGLPVLEARACGVPIVASDIPELREAGGENCIYVHPDEVGLKQGILAALSLKRSEVGAMERPSWTDGAKILAAALTGKPLVKPKGQSARAELH